MRVAERGDKRRLRELAERNARLALDQDRLRREHRRQRRVESLADLREALRMEELPVRIEGFDISNLGGEHTVASMVVFEGGATKKSDYRRFRVAWRWTMAPAAASGPDDFASMEEVLDAALNRYLEQADLSPHDGKRDESFASLPSLVVIDGGKGQLAAGMRALRPFAERGVDRSSASPSGEEEVYVPGRSAPIDLAADSEASQLLQRVRDEAHRFAIEHHRGRRDRAMTGSVLDGLKGVGPARKRALLQHFGSPERFLAATREELEAVPGVPGKLAREIHEQLNRTGWSEWRRGGSTLVVITGHSGAGKSEAIAAFEDGGYFCVDNLPPRMIGSLGELFRHEGSGVERAAVVSDVRGGEYFDDLLQVLDDLEADGLQPTLLFLEADEETLLDRYKETRRRHPLAPEGRIVDGIRAERELLAPLRERADVVMDTSDLTGAMLRRRIAEEMLGHHESGKLALTLLTFGFKNGPPRDADLTLDVRFLPNPHYVDELRPLTGLDERGARVRRVGHPGGRVLRPAAAAARVPRPRLRRRGQEPPDDRRRLHRRPAPLGHGRRPDPPRPGRPRRRRRPGQAPRRRAWTEREPRPSHRRLSARGLESPSLV